MNFKQEFILSISSQSSIIYIVTDEEERLENAIQIISTQIFTTSISKWDFINGYIGNPNESKKALRNPLEALEIVEKYNLKTPKIFLLKDFHIFFNDSTIIRKIKNIIQYKKKTNSYIVICSSSIQIPEILNEYIKVIYFPLPNHKEIEHEIIQILNLVDKTKNKYIKNLTNKYLGFSIRRVRTSLSEIILSNLSIEDSLKKIDNEKRNLIQQTDILDFYPNKENLKKVGGLYNLKNWLKKRRYSFSNKAQNYGLPNPKGILLVGIQGTGKSLSAKAISEEWNLPLLKLDMGKIFGSLVGESEARIRQAIDISEKCAPCILWVDEIDKGFTKHAFSNDSGTTNRVLGVLLTWLSEKNTHVFVVATTNTLINLPTEIIRKGRFDEIFFLDLPNYKERKHIFKIHLKKFRPLTWSKYDIEYLSKITEKFSGAEIEQVIIEAMYDSFYENREFKTNDIVNAINNIIPLAFVDKEDINKLQEWAYSGKVRLA